MAETQSARPFRLKTTLGDDALLLESFTGTERISTPFRYQMRVLSEDANIGMKDLLTKPAVLSLRLTDEEEERHIHGHIVRMRFLEVGDDSMAAYEVEMAPWLWFLNHRHDCRIFQNKTVPEIVEKVFTDRGYSDYRLLLTGSYTAREYCVQYRETDFNFVSRLMEEEGIFYFFEQTEEKHTLVLADAPSPLSACPHKATARFTPSHGGVLEEDTVASIEQEYQLTTGKTTFTDYNFQMPTTSLMATLSGSAPGQRGEFYDYPGGHTTKAEGDRYARIRLEEWEATIVKVRGHSNCMGFECGFKFELKENTREEANQEYLIVALDQAGRNTSYQSGSPTPFEYSNSFEAIPFSVPFRPPRLGRKPLIHGTQTALVVGKSGEEIYTDDFGRIKVQFYWDREGKRDENSSCWIRVAQGWAGKQWGSMFIPRMGHEVVVSFLEGDPDRPLITGSVYNADQTVPYTLPGEGAKSGIKSLSTKGGGGFNEIRMDDSKDSEQVFIHGQKDIDIRIEKDRREWIGQDRHLIVKRDKLEEVDFDSHVEIKQDHKEKIGRDRFLKIVGKEAVEITGTKSLKVTDAVADEFGNNHTEKTTGDYYLHARNVTIEADMALTIMVGGNFVMVDKTGVTILGSPMVKINSGGAAVPGVPGVLVPASDPKAVTEAKENTAGGMVTYSAAGEQPGSEAGGDISGAGSASPGGSSSDPPRHNPNDEAHRDKTHFIEIELVDDEGQPVAGEQYEVVLPDGTTVASGTTDSRGRARVANIDPGQCTVRFPRIDQSALESS